MRFSVQLHLSHQLKTVTCWVMLYKKIICAEIIILRMMGVIKRFSILTTLIFEHHFDRFVRQKISIILIYCPSKFKQNLINNPDTKYYRNSVNIN